MEYLGQQPICQARLQQEVQNNLSPENCCRTYTMIDQLPYLNAVVMETLRLVDTIESFQPRLVPGGGRTIDGYFLPAGTIVSSHPYLMNRNPELFASPHVFDPDRWLQGKDAYTTLSKYLFTFSRGPHACIGRELATAGRCPSIIQCRDFSDAS